MTGMIGAAIPAPCSCPPPLPVLHHSSPLAKHASLQSPSTPEVGPPIHDLDAASISSLLQDHTLSLRECTLFHARIVGLGLEQNTSLVNLLIRSYVRCHDFTKASFLFNKLDQRDVVSWNTTMGVYAQNHTGIQAIHLIHQMASDRVAPDRITYLNSIRICAKAASLVEGEQIHALIIHDGCAGNLILATALVHMYGRCGDVDGSKVTFSKISEPDVAAYNSLIGAYARKGQSEEAFSVFSEMREQGMNPNKITFVNALSACVLPEHLPYGKSIHSCIAHELLESDAIVGNALTTMYGKCGDLENVRSMFSKISKRTVVSWTAMITECTRQGSNREALDLFYRMKEEGVEPDKITFVSALSACASLESLVEGKDIHRLITLRGFDLDDVTGSALVNMYGKCNLIDDAFSAFKNICLRTVISWNAMIAVYVQHGLGNEALELYRIMQVEGIEPDKVTFIGALSACACIGALDEGIAIHNHVLSYQMESDFVVSNAIVNMYGKCADLQKAQSVFDNMEKRSVVTWTALITAYAQQGHGNEALNLYHKMQEENVKPNETTFLSLISACSHSGLVEDGLFYFFSMKNDYGIEPTNEHYGSMVDLLGRAGLLIEAEDFISKMPFEADACIWTSLLGACRMHGDIERAKKAAENVVHLEGNNASAYVLLSNTYSLDGRKNDLQRIKRVMTERGIDKRLGCSLIQLDGRIHCFFSGDNLHPKIQEIHKMAKSLMRSLEKGGYGVTAENNDSIQHESEILAIAFGLITASATKPLYILKTVEMSATCHTAVKYISEVVEREINVDDSCQCHSFKQGSCSCESYT